MTLLSIILFLLASILVMGPRLYFPAPLLEGSPEPTDSDVDARPFYETTTNAEWMQAFDEWSLSHSTETPLIPDEALRRENLYEDRGL